MAGCFKKRFTESNLLTDLQNIRQQTPRLFSWTNKILLHLWLCTFPYSQPLSRTLLWRHKLFFFPPLLFQYFIWGTVPAPKRDVIGFPGFLWGSLNGPAMVIPTSIPFGSRRAVQSPSGYKLFRASLLLHKVNVRTAVGADQLHSLCSELY